MFKVNHFSNKEINISAVNQEWTQEDFKKLRDEYDIIYNGGTHAIYIEKRSHCEPIFNLMGEDDGNLFLYNHEVKFSYSWTQDLISILELAKNHVRNHRKKYSVKKTK